MLQAALPKVVLLASLDFLPYHLIFQLSLRSPYAQPGKWGSSMGMALTPKMNANS